MSDEIIDKEIETMNSDRIHKEIILPKLKSQLKYILEKSKFYKNKLKNQNVEQLIENFQDIPFTQKQEIIIDQKNFPPFGSNVCVDTKDIFRVHKTSGTTARPVFIALTKKDIEKTIIAGRRSFWSAGLRSHDTVVNCLNYCLWMGGFTDHQSLEATDATVIPFGVGNSINLIQTILDVKPTAIHCTPSYLAKLELLLKEKFKMEPKELGLKKGFFGGESGLQNPDFKKAIEDKWNLKAMNANYGLSDVLSIFGSECSERNGLHFMGQGLLLPEIIDPKTQKNLLIKKGVSGELVLTNLEKEAQPLIRFRTNDIIEILNDNTCECGRTSFKFKILGRSDDMIIVKGINIFPSAIGEAISKFLDKITGEFQIIASKQEPIDKITLKIETKKDCSNLDTLKKEILETIKQKFDLTPDIKLINEGLLGRTEGKTKRLIRV